MIERLRPYSVVLHGVLWDGLRELCDYHDVRRMRIPSQREMAFSKKEARCG